MSDFFEVILTNDPKYANATQAEVQEFIDDEFQYCGYITEDTAPSLIEYVESTYNFTPTIPETVSAL